LAVYRTDVDSNDIHHGRHATTEISIAIADDQLILTTNDTLTLVTLKA